MGIIEEKWEHILSTTSIRKLSAKEIEVFRRVFYTGSLCIFSIIKEIGYDDNISQDDGCSILNSIQAELIEFTKILDSDSYE